MKTKKYQVPRHLGLEALTKKSKDQWSCEFGFNKKTKRWIDLDQEALDLLKFLFTARSLVEVCQNTALSEPQAVEVLNQLQDAGLVEQIQEREARFERYDRHFLFYAQNGINPLEAQTKLSNCRVSLIGVGGIGNWVALNLVGLGLKEIRLIDFDTVELTNLTRQVLFEESSIGKSKIQEATRFLSPRNSQTRFVPLEASIRSEEQVAGLIEGSDFVVVSADRPKSIHDWIDRACVRLGIPYINLGYRDSVGGVGPLTVPGQTSCYHCFKSASQAPEAPPKNLEADDCIEMWDRRYQAPSFGPLNAMVSTMGTLEMIKYFCAPETLRTLDCELAVDPMSFEIKEHHFVRDPHCKHCREV